MYDKLIESDFNDPVYCYTTNGDSTMKKHEELYLNYVNENRIENYFVKCIKNCKYNGVEYYNGVIYKVNDNIRYSKNFKISNVYSIYCTQGQTMKKINLLKDDYKKYYSSIEMVYVLISRIKN